MRLKLLIAFISVSLFISSAFSQGMAFGPKGGMSLGIQKWDSSLNRDPLLAWHGAFYIESLPDNSEYIAFGQLGYHVRGSSIQTQSFVSNDGRVFNSNSTKFQFNNLVLIGGLKKMYELNSGNYLFYGFGLRAEYNINTNLDDFSERNKYRAIFPIDNNVKKILYGFTIVGGFDYMISDLIGITIEGSVHPDASNQYHSFPIDNIIDPLHPGQTYSLRERKIRNLSFEISIGLRFLRKVIYDD